MQKNEIVRESQISKEISTSGTFGEIEAQIESECRNAK